MTSLELETRLDNLLATAQIETAAIDLYAPMAEREECPLCLIPLPFNENQSLFKICCGKIICTGCAYKHLLTCKEDKKGVAQALKEFKCPFCQQPGPKNNIKSLKKLMKKNNPRAFISMAAKYESGKDVVIQSDTKALEMRIRAAELGYAQAFSIVALNYMDGLVVKQSTSKAFEFLEVAAKKGSRPSHEYLARLYGRNGNIQKCIKHYKVVASAGHKDAMDKLMKAYTDKRVSKEDLTRTLRAYQASKDLMKSKDREDVRDLMDAYLSIGRRGGEAPAELLDRLNIKPGR